MPGNHNLYNKLLEAVSPNGGRIYVTGTTVPSGGTAGYEEGCIFFKTDATNINEFFYLNIGSVTSCDFDAVSDTVGSLAVASAKLIVGNASGVGAAVDLSGDATLANDGALTLVSASKDYGIVLTDLREHDDLDSPLPDAADATYLGLADTAGALVTGTTTNGGSTASASESAGFHFTLPSDYVAGEDLELVVRSKVSADRGTSQTVDAVVKLLGDAGLGADINADSAITLTEAFADHSFTITGTTLSPADVLHVQITMATDDTTATADGYPVCSAIKFQVPVKGQGA